MKKEGQKFQVEIFKGSIAVSAAVTLTIDGHHVTHFETPGYDVIYALEALVAELKKSNTAPWLASDWKTTYKGSF